MVRCAWAALLSIVTLAVARADEAPQATVGRPVDQRYLESLARRIEPDLKGRADRLQQYVDFFRREAANDVRLFAFDVKAEAKGHGVRLTGFVEFPETRNAIVGYFNALGFDPVENEIETLPAAELGEKRYGVVKASNSLSYAEPAEEEIVTDCLLGEAVFLLREADGHFLVHGGDGYLGYVAAEDVQRFDAEAFAKYLAGPRVCLRADHDADDGVALPAGARLKLVRQSGGGVVAELPTGEKVSLPADVCEVRDAPAERIDVVCNNARQLLGTEYLWGGKTSRGVDCSGLVQLSFASAGVTLPRDSNQQYLVGQLTGTRWCRAGLRRGDTLYFINPQGRVSHTGLYLGDDQFIHAVSPVVRVNSFNPNDGNYAPSQDASFAFAKRLW